MDLQVKEVNDLLRDLNIDTDDEVGTQSSTLAGANSDNDEPNAVLSSMAPNMWRGKA
jgi:hypothetical protein